MIRSWNPDFVVAVGDDNYILGEAATIDTNIGKNFSDYIYPKGTGYPEYYPYPPGAPAYNRFFSALGNHDYGDVGDDFPPTTEKIALSVPYVNYLTNSLLGPQAPNTTINFANNAVGQSYDTDKDGYVCGSYAAFTEATNIGAKIEFSIRRHPRARTLIRATANWSARLPAFPKKGVLVVRVLASNGAVLQQNLTPPGFRPAPLRGN